MRAAIGNRLVCSDEIDAVINLLTAVFPLELTHITDGDREYVANEMTAFLLAWLSELPCPVIDRATPLSLAGCGRWPAEWAALGERVGVRTDVAWTGETVKLTVVGGRVVAGEAGIDAAWAVGAEAVARAAGRSLVTLQFADNIDEPVLVGALPRPAVGSAAVADALLAWIDST
jgi:hypothetical protein